MAGSASTVAAVLRRQIVARADHPLLICDDDRLTYADAGRRSAALAAELIARGAGKGTHIGLLHPNGTDFVTTMLAAARIGAVVIPFSTFATAPELHEQLIDSDTEILVTAEGFRSHDYVRRLAELVGDTALADHTVILDPKTPRLRHVLVEPKAGESVAPPLLSAMEDDVDGSDVLAIVYTSGSTSTPKGVIHTNAGLIDHQRNLNRIRHLGADDTLFCNSPFFWIGGFAFGILATLVAGSTLVCSNAENAAATLDLLEREKPNTTNGFAAGIAHLTRDASFPDRDLSSLRRGNLYPIMPERPSDPELRHNMLGMTEAGSVLLISDDESDQPEHRRGSYGRPAPGFDTTIVDPETGTAVDAGEVGELCIRGPYVMQRYQKRSREESFDSDGWFHTGDLVRVDDDGFVYFVGRRGAMIKTSGANVAPAEVERAIAKITGGTAHVIGLPDAQRGQLVAAVIVADTDADDGGEVDEVSLRARLKVELSAYKIPRRFIVVPRSGIPLLSSGKVDSTRLVRMFDV